MKCQKGEQRNTGRTHFKKGFIPWNKGVLLKKECLRCLNKFEVQPYRKDAKFCSIACARKGAARKKKGIIKVCETCFKTFYVPKAHSYRKYCSHNCAKVVHIGRRPANFKGDDVSYRGLHYWVVRHLGKPANCSRCGIIGYGRRMHWANKSRNYQRIKSDWIRLCPKCHKAYDHIPIARSA
jgi:hypothetical protein